MPLLIGTTVGICVLVAAILFVTFAVIGRRIDAAAAALPGVELDSGRVRLTTRFDGFRSQQLRRGGIRTAPARVVLTSTHLHVVERPQRYGRFARADLGRFGVRADGRAVVLRSTDPPGASGTIEYRFPADDAARWVAALTAAGASQQAAQDPR